MLTDFFVLFCFFVFELVRRQFSYQKKSWEKNDKKLGEEAFWFLFDSRQQSRCSTKEAVYLKTNRR